MLSTYDANSENAVLGDEFSNKTLEEIKQFFPEAKHSVGLNPEYDIIIPDENLGFPKIECKVCGSLVGTNGSRYVKIPLNLVMLSEAKFVRIRYTDLMGEFKDVYFRLSSLRSYYNKMKAKAKVIDQGDRKVILWPAHLLDGMRVKIETTQELVEYFNKELVLRKTNSV